MRSFYLAGSAKRQIDCREVAFEIERRTGVACLSRWLNIEMNGKEVGTPAIGAAARMDITDIRTADCLIALVGDEHSLGKNVEIGIALALYKPVLLVYPPWANTEVTDLTCVFYSLCDGPVFLAEPIAMLGEVE